MAKSKGFFGLRSGSTKNFTFSELNGQQITKERVYKVKNPRTMQQMRQRMVMATVSSAYGYLKEICDHSFEGFGVGAPCMSEFIKANIDLLKADAQDDNAMVAFNAYQDKGINPVEFMVSRGSIDIPGTYFTFNALGGLEFANSSIPATNLSTAEDCYKALGLQRGDMITFLLSSLGAKEDEKNNSVSFFPNGPLAILRVRCDKEGAISNVANAFSVESNNINGINVKFDTDQDGILEITASLKEHRIANLGCVIISRQDNGKWLRSTSSMVLNETKDQAVGDFMTTVAKQLASYPVERDLILNGSGLAEGEVTLPKPTLSLNPTSVSITTKGGTAQPPTLTGTPAGAQIKYTIGNDAVASVDASTGVATAKANGSTYVSIFVGATESSSATSIRYNLTVTGQDTDAGGGDENG